MIYTSFFFWIIFWIIISLFIYSKILLDSLVEINRNKFSIKLMRKDILQKVDELKKDITKNIYMANNKNNYGWKYNTKK